MPSLTTVALDKSNAFKHKKTVHTKSISSSSPSFLDITPALQQYLSSLLSFTHSPFSQSVSPFKDSLTIRTSKHSTLLHISSNKHNHNQKRLQRNPPSSVSNVVGFHWVPDMSCFFWQREVHFAISQQATVGKGWKEIPFFRLERRGGFHWVPNMSCFFWQREVHLAISQQATVGKGWKEIPLLSSSALKSYERMIFAFALFSWTFQDSMMIPVVFAMKSNLDCLSSMFNFDRDYLQYLFVAVLQSELPPDEIPPPVHNLSHVALSIVLHGCAATYNAYNQESKSAFRSGYAEETGSQPQLHRFDWWCITSSPYSPW